MGKIFHFIDEADSHRLWRECFDDPRPECSMKASPVVGNGLIFPKAAERIFQVMARQQKADKGE